MVPFTSARAGTTATTLRVTLAAADDLQLVYRVSGLADLVCLARAASPVRRDELWRRTCAELFVADPLGEGYLEFNFSPSGDWAAYAFEAPRRGQRVHRWRDEASSPPRVTAVWVGDPRVETSAVFELQVVLPWGALAGRRADASRDLRRVGLTFVAERTHDLGYWALTHVGAQPDFHHPDSFLATLEVPPCAHSP